MNYIVITSGNITSLIVEVNKALSKGYILVGGISTSFNGYINSVEYLQAMLK